MDLTQILKEEKIIPSIKQTSALLEMCESGIGYEIVRFITLSDLPPESISMISEVIKEIKPHISEEDILHRLSLIRSVDMSKKQIENILIGNWD